jgi:amino acid adenylation domain-containing protein
MTSAREELLQLLRTRSAGQRRETVTQVVYGDPVPLDPNQARIWHFSQLFPDSAEYNAFHTMRVPSAPDEERLTAVLRTLIERHDALRLRIFQQDGVPVQEDIGPYDPEVTWHDLSGEPEAEAEQRATALVSDAAREVIRPDEPPLVRFTAIKMPSGAALLVFGFHHVIEDGWSWALLSGELADLLAGRTLEPTAPVRFIDYVASRHENLDETRKARALAYWTTKLGGGLPILNLPADRPRPAVPSRRGHTLQFDVPAAALPGAQRLAEQEKTTLFVVTLAAYKALLARLTGQADHIVGSAFAGRDDAIAERLVGCFVKSVALRTGLTGADSFRAAVREVRATVLEAQDHQTVPFEEIVANLDITRDLNVEPVFQTHFAFHEVASPDVPGMELDPIGFVGSGSTKWDITLLMSRTPNGLAGVLEGSADLFDKATLERFARIYVRLFEDLVAEPDQRIDAHPMVSAAERDRILYDLNPYARPEHPYRTLAEPFEEQVERTPDAIALVGDEGTLTYAELNRRANRLARFLRGQGVRPGTRVALCLDRGFAMVVAIYAVAKAGATYVPLDPELPDDRLAFMLEDTAPPVVLTDGAEGRRIPEGSWDVVCLDDTSAWDDLPGDDPRWPIPAGQSSHLLYTSGTTGRPKAVASAVDGSIADIQWMQRRYPYRPGDTAIFKTSYGFDVSLWEFCWPLYVGARVFVCRPGGHRDVQYLAAMIERYGVTAAYIIPTQLQVFLDELPAGACPTLRWVLSGGEPVTPRLRDTCHQRLTAQLVNGYGPTEAGRTTDMIVPKDPGNPVVPLGRPSPNFRLCVLDDDLRVNPVGVPGEAYIAAEVGLAHGYFRRPELTAERFLPDPYGPPGARMYRTGDVCRYRDDGVLEHLGRIGNQVKIRGMRIELAEIEAVLCEHPDVQGCVTLAVDIDGQPDLAAFVVVSAGAQPAESTLKDHAARMLPAHMVPTSIQVVETIPVNVNGKTDRQTLLNGWKGRSAGAPQDVVLPADDLEAAVARIFGRILGLDDVSMTDGFFDRGGHSLLVFKLLSAIAAELNVQLQAADVFTAPTARELADRIRSGSGGDDVCVVPLRPAPGRPMVVFVHAASGSALPFQEIAERLAGDFSVYGLEAPGDDRDASSIEEMAARYVAELDPIRDYSPICLVGWSMGGAVAMEMAREWRRRDVEVAATVMLDSWPPPALFDAEAERERQRRAIKELDIGAAEGVDPASLGVAGERLTRVTERNRQALLDYRPEPYDGQVHHLRATGPLPGADIHPVGDGGDWTRVVGDLVRGETLGTHFSLLRGDNAAELAATITDIAEQSLSYEEL